jgi:hypothetical protein
MVRLLTFYICHWKELSGERYALMYPQQENHRISRTYKIISPAADYLCSEKWRNNLLRD